jgi:putative ABC transport system permease protein
MHGRGVLRLLRRLSLPYLRTSWGRSALVVGGIATGVALIVAIDVINASVLHNFRRTIEGMAGPAELAVTLGVGEIGFAETTVDTVRADPGVAVVIPMVRGTIGVASDPGTTLQLFGVDLTAEEDLARYQVTTTDRRRILARMDDPTSILLSVTFAADHGLAVGSTIALSTPAGVRQVTVQGLLDATGVASFFGGRLAVMDLGAAQTMLAKAGRVDQIDVVLADGAAVTDVEGRLRNALPPTLTVARPAQRGAEYDRVLGSFQAMLTGLSLLCLVAGIYIIYNTTSTAAVHRALVMAGLRLQGADGRQLFRLLMIEALGCGILGAAMGIAYGIVLAKLLVGMVADSMSVIFQLRFPVDALAVHWRQLPLVAAAGIGATLIASYAAARRVARLEPLAVMRADLRTVAAAPAHARLVGGWLVLVAISAAALVLEVRHRSIAWGNFGSTLWFAATIVIAIPAVAASRAVFARLLPRVFGVEGRVATDSLYRSPTRTGVTVGAIALVIIIGLTSASLSWSLSRNISNYFSGGPIASDLAVSAVTTDGGWLETPLPDTLAAELATIPGVRRTETIRILPGQLFRGARIALGGTSPALFQAERYPSGWFRAGDPVAATAALRAGTGVTISDSLADRFALAVGDTIDLDAPAGRVTLSVVGIVPDYMSDQGGVVLSRDLLVRHWDDHAINRVLLFLDPEVSPETVRRAIGERFASRYVLKVLSPAETVAFHAAQVDRAFALVDAIQLLIVAVTIAGILDLLLSSILERRRELSLWRMIGADARSVRRSILIESGTIGLCGIVLGFALGSVTAWIWVGINFRYLLGYYLDFYFAWSSAAWFFVLVSLTTLTAGHLAAASAARQSILDGLRVD